MLSSLWDKARKLSAAAFASAKPDAPKVFISHASGDKARLTELISFLYASGFHIWIDRPDELRLPAEIAMGDRVNGLQAGVDWKNTIAESIKDVDVVLAFWSTEALSNRSETFLYELYQGFVQQKLIQCALDNVSAADVGAPYSFEQMAPVNLDTDLASSSQLKALNRSIWSAALAFRRTRRHRQTFEALFCNSRTYVLLAPLLITILLTSWRMSSLEAAKTDYTGMVEPFRNCQTQVVYPTAIFREQQSDRKSDQTMLIHHNGKARIYLSAWQLKEDETLLSALESHVRQAPEIAPAFPKCFPGYPDCSGGSGKVSGYYPDAQNRQKIEFYVRLQLSPDGRFMHKYEMVHPAEPGPAGHIYWDVNELVSATMKPSSKVSYIDPSCAGRDIHTGAAAPSPGAKQ